MPIKSLEYNEKRAERYYDYIDTINDLSFAQAYARQYYNNGMIVYGRILRKKLQSAIKQLSQLEHDLRWEVDHRGKSTQICRVSEDGQFLPYGLNMDEFGAYDTEGVYAVDTELALCLDKFIFDMKNMGYVVQITAGFIPAYAFKRLNYFKREHTKGKAADIVCDNMTPEELGDTMYAWARHQSPEPAIVIRSHGHFVHVGAHRQREQVKRLRFTKYSSGDNCLMLR